SQVHWKSESELGIDVTPSLSLASGLYDVDVTNPDGRHAATFPGGLVAVPRPTLTNVAADLLCDAGDDQTVVVTGTAILATGALGERHVTLTGTGFLEVGTTLPKVAFGEQTFDAASVGGCTALTGNTFAEGTVSSCTSLTVTVPSGALAAGDHAVVVTNPSPA